MGGSSPVPQTLKKKQLLQGVKILWEAAVSF